jgi:phosphoribosylformimino-5-aminoimidazole carboxamide ribotide isomerase
VTVLPAIDLRGGRCVRLVQGAFDRETVFADDPLAVARRWEAAGARWLHVVDLDGARAGRPLQAALVRAVCGAVGIPVQVGGGLRTREDVDAVLAGGAARAVLGTVAARDPERCRAICGAHPGRVVVGLDARAGVLSVEGWTEDTRLDAPTQAVAAAEAGAAAVVYTNIARDGTERGPDLDGTRAVAHAARIPVILSGGIGSLDDIRAVCGLAADGVTGMIVGRALYTGAVALADALAAAGDA